MCKNGLGLFPQKWLPFLEIWWIKFLQNDKQHLLLKSFTNIFIFDWVISIFMFFDQWWRHVLAHLKKYVHINTQDVVRISIIDTDANSRENQVDAANTHNKLESETRTDEGANSLN